MRPADGAVVEPGPGDRARGHGVIVGINLLYLLPGVVGGTETYAEGLLLGLSRVADPDTRFVIYSNEEGRDWTIPADPRFSRVVCPVRATSRSARYWYEQRSLPRRAREDGVDVVHSLGYVAPLALGCPSVLTVPDVHYLVHGRAGDWPRRLLLRFFVRESVAKASAVIAISRFTRDVLERTYRLAPGAVDVVLLAAKERPKSEGSSDTGRIEALGVRRPYLMAFGGVTPNKNIGRLLQAYRLAREKSQVQQTLVIVGRLAPDQRAVDLPGVSVTGYLPDDLVAILLRHADALVFPSLYEGFGLPVLEGMAAGTPVVCSSAAALPEIGGSACLYFDPENVADMAEKMTQVCGDASIRNRLREQGLARVAEFSWEQTARQTLAIYRRVLSTQGQRGRS